MAGTLTKIKLITFDAYNTLFKLNKNPAKIYANEACHYGIHVPSKSIESSFGRVYKEQLRQKPFYGLHQGLSPSDWWKETVYKTFLGAGVSKQKLDPIYDPLFNSLFNCFTLRKYYLLYPDVTPTLELLKQYGFKIGVISNTDERIVSLMQNLNIDKYFDFIVSGVQVGSEKPSTEIFDRARCLSPKSIQPEEVLHVGDDEERYVMYSCI
ncbi:HAD-like domain-containing protein [Pilobolus umbonatus]|nr:HAD-like domain-containing protein [Pilobolus umbonatus]